MTLPPHFLFSPSSNTPYFSLRHHDDDHLISRTSGCRFTTPITMSSCSHTPVPTVKPITISFSEIKDKNKDLSDKIERGFGPNGLGILCIKDVPGYSSLRQNLLSLSRKLASLPEDTKKKLEDPGSRYNFGWSHGKEKLESGKPDMLKGSFYANPVLDVPTTDTSLVSRYPSYCGSNLWPDSALPELEPSFKALGKLILDVGVLLAYHCDQYVSRGTREKDNDCLEQTLVRSRCHKGRLLYYFPAEQSQSSGDNDSMSSWCGWHTDHGSLTGLACAMFMKNGVEVPSVDSSAGLYIRDRSEKLVKVIYGEDEIAYQIGETTEILSKGYLCATPHCVRAPKGESSRGLERSTFALFMQPDWDEKLNFPEEVHIHKELIKSNGALTFGEYTELLLDKYYHTRT